MTNNTSVKVSFDWPLMKAHNCLRFVSSFNICTKDRGFVPMDTVTKIFFTSIQHPIQGYVSLTIDLLDSDINLDRDLLSSNYQAKQRNLWHDLLRVSWSNVCTCDCGVCFERKILADTTKELCERFTKLIPVLINLNFFVALYFI